MSKKLDTTEGAAKNGTKLAPKRRTAVKAATAPKKAIAPRKKAPSDADIALRAYLIGERRMKLGLPGDAMSDWLQAEQELRA